jgi:hypothetical protein
MALQPEGVLASCQRVETMLRDVQQRVLVPRAETLAECEIQLGQIAVLLETLRESMVKDGAKDGAETGAPSVFPTGNTAIRQKLQQIRHTARKLKIQFEYGSNYYMGLLQLRLGTGYSEKGRPVLIPSKARSCFEG